MEFLSIVFLSTKEFQSLLGKNCQITFRSIQYICTDFFPSYIGAKCCLVRLSGHIVYIAHGRNIGILRYFSSS